MLCPTIRIARVVINIDQDAAAVTVSVIPPTTMMYLMDLRISCTVRGKLTVVPVFEPPPVTSSVINIQY